MPSKLILLDACILGMVSHPTGNEEIKNWLQSLLRADIMIFIPEIADYEVRRELLRAGKTRSIIRMDTLKVNLTYLPLNTEMMVKAARFWADARNKGFPTADDKSLDADVILAAQADILHTLTGVETIIATTNVGHLSRFVKADKWENIK